MTHPQDLSLQGKGVYPFWFLNNKTNYILFCLINLKRNRKKEKLVREHLKPQLNDLQRCIIKYGSHYPECNAPWHICSFFIVMHWNKNYSLKQNLKFRTCWSKNRIVFFFLIIFWFPRTTHLCFSALKPHQFANNCTFINVLKCDTYHSSVFSNI